MTLINFWYSQKRTVSNSSSTNSSLLAIALHTAQVMAATAKFEFTDAIFRYGEDQSNGY